MSPKKVVVTGGSGRVGRYVLDELARAFDVRNADLAPAAAGPNGRPPANVEYMATDVMDLDEVRAALKGADAVVHLAAIDYDWKAAPEKYIRVNTLGTWNVLQAAEENGLEKVVLCSSISACGLSEMRPDWTPQYLQVDEDHEIRPVQAYSLSKQIMENMGQAVSRGSGMSVICIRPLAVVLPEALTEFTEFIDNPELRWLFYYIEASDLARAFRAAVEAEGLGFDTFFISADDTCHPEPTLDWYPRVIGGNVPQHDAALFQNNPRASIFSSARAKEKLGWAPTSNFLHLRAAQGHPLPETAAP
ncbi:NAD-dependent epimerase/dehydratase family protein [Arthrobacter sulfonylureivorans]|uniref:NAD(P)-dependent oxidoreductase n=1 Tax=Arthrobacter sulfonylureivorans TaxID=2486855 RepID=A0ABY3WCR7_9MICC|nr:NAD(P)-dependent oxidoreductase [Arthrobacter sulfonylureivorans]UNK46097.1 NAD(P)-dependent oxidoreductase [Arthrobacter sulfonylureivorans]